MAAFKTYTFAPGTVIFKEIEPLHRNEKGWIVSASGSGDNQDHPVLQPRLVKTGSGRIRGNHFHQETETTILLNGSWEWVLADTNEPKPVKVEIQVEDLPYMVIIPPGIAHAVKNTGKEPAFLFHYSDTAYQSDRSHPFEVMVE